MVDIAVNGETRHLEVPTEMPLLWALRDVVGLTGTKFSCGAGLCGACTVLVDGAAVRSCVTPVGSVGAGKVTTIEGLSPDGHHRVQDAWVAEAVAQCGYCQPGQILTAVALLAKNPNPDDATIDTVFAASLCRCGTYVRIRRAVHRAAGAA